MLPSAKAMAVEASKEIRLLLKGRLYPLPIVHQKLIYRVVVVSVPNGKRSYTQLGSAEVGLQRAVYLCAIDVGEAIVAGKSCLSNIYFLHCWL
jgi:hypothetical protein